MKLLCITLWKIRTKSLTRLSSPPHLLPVLLCHWAVVQSFFWVLHHVPSPPSFALPRFLSLTCLYCSPFPDPFFGSGKQAGRVFAFKSQLKYHICKTYVAAYFPWQSSEWRLLSYLFCNMASHSPVKRRNQILYSFDLGRLWSHEQWNAAQGTFWALPE